MEVASLIGAGWLRDAWSQLVWGVGEGHPEGSRTVPRKAADGTWLPPRAPRGGGRVVGKSRVQRGFLSLPGGLLE